MSSFSINDLFFRCLRNIKMIDTSPLSIAHHLQPILNNYPQVLKLVHAIDAQHGRALLVGGAVRDLVLGIPVKDLDIEVHGLNIAQLEQILRTFGPVSLVGKAFGVLRLHGLDVDWSLPRVDSSGRKPQVHIDPFMSIKEAFRRRDLTINAMGIDLTTFELVDPFDGKEDLKKGILRAPDTTLFVEDPLRFFRVMQFIGRFEMKPDESLNAVCKTMDISQVSKERISTEFEKLLLKSKQPSLGFRWLLSIGRLGDVLPELQATIPIKQDPRWHPEGNLFEHSMQTLDAAVRLHYEHDAKLIMLYAALCHDLGKITTTVQEPDGSITCYGHDKAGVPITRRLLKRITLKKSFMRPIEKLVRYHMQPSQFINGGAKAPAYKRLARKLAPDVSMQMLADLSLADGQGCNPNGHKPLLSHDPDTEAFRKKAQEINVLEQAEQPILQGRDLLGLVNPGKEMGMLLKKAYTIQMEEGIKDKEVLKQRVLNDQ